MTGDNNMEANISIDTSKPVIRSRRFATLDFARGVAIFLMIGLHTLSLVLNIDDMLKTLDTRALINLVMLVIIPFYGGLAGFFLLVSSASNMVSMYRDLERGNSIRGIVFKQIFGGVLLLIFAMLCEGLIGYHGAFGNFFLHLDNPASYFQYNQLLNFEHWEGGFTYNWQTLLFRWNHFETIHTIAWCIILNGMVQGILSLKKNWQNRRQMMISYAILAVVVVGLTQPIWDLVNLYGPGYPFGIIPETGNVLFTPVIGEDKWWRIIAAPFLSAVAAPMEPLFPYLAISFIGSIIGIEISRPKEEINKKFPRNMFIIGSIMFVSGLIGVAVIIIGIMSNASLGFDTAVNIYKLLSYHRHYSPHYQSYIPEFSWVPQFLIVNGFAIMLVMLLFRLIEYRGRSKAFSDKTKFVRRFGTVAFSNYNNQWIYFLMFYLLSYAIYFTPYAKFYWAGTLLVIIVVLAIYTLLLIGWEKIKYIGSLEWFIRTINNNLVPARKQRFDSTVKWWQKGQIDVEGAFYNPEWIDLVDPVEEKEKNEEQFIEEKYESRLALTLSLVGLFTIILNAASIFALFASLRARKLEGKNKKNTRAFIISIVGCVFFAAFYIACFSIKIGLLGIEF
jgi:hypothetical protein